MAAIKLLVTLEPDFGGTVSPLTNFPQRVKRRVVIVVSRPRERANDLNPFNRSFRIDDFIGDEESLEMH